MNIARITFATFALAIAAMPAAADTASSQPAPWASASDETGRAPGADRAASASQDAAAPATGSTRAGRTTATAKSHRATQRSSSATGGSANRVDESRGASSLQQRSAAAGGTAATQTRTLTTSDDARASARDWSWGWFGLLGLFGLAGLLRRREHRPVDEVTPETPAATPTQTDARLYGASDSA